MALAQNENEWINHPDGFFPRVLRAAGRVEHKTHQLWIDPFRFWKMKGSRDWLLWHVWGAMTHATPVESLPLTQNHHHAACMAFSDTCAGNVWFQYVLMFSGDFQSVSAHLPCIALDLQEGQTAGQLLSMGMMGLICNDHRCPSILIKLWSLATSTNLAKNQVKRCQKYMSS